MGNQFNNFFRASLAEHEQRIESLENALRLLHARHSCLIRDLGLAERAQHDEAAKTVTFSYVNRVQAAREEFGLVPFPGGDIVLPREEPPVVVGPHEERDR